MKKKPTPVASNKLRLTLSALRKWVYLILALALIGFGVAISNRFGVAHNIRIVGYLLQTTTIAILISGWTLFNLYHVPIKLITPILYGVLTVLLTYSVIAADTWNLLRMLQLLFVFINIGVTFSLWRHYKTPAIRKEKP